MFSQLGAAWPQGPPPRSRALSVHRESRQTQPSREPAHCGTCTPRCPPRRPEGGDVQPGEVVGCGAVGWGIWQPPPPQPSCLPPWAAAPLRGEPPLLSHPSIWEKNPPPRPRCGDGRWSFLSGSHSPGGTPCPRGLKGPPLAKRGEGSRLHLSPEPQGCPSEPPSLVTLMCEHSLPAPT